MTVATRKSRGRNAFTLAELMVVISIIVLMLAVAVPVVRVVQGNRSIEAGYNSVAAALGHARQLAIYYRQPAGVVFYRDPINNAQDVGYVMRANFIGQNSPALFTQTPYSAGESSLSDSFVDMIPGEPVLTLPSGLAVQVVMGNGGPVAGTINGKSISVPERYMRVGVVLFDENGQLVSTPYQIHYLSLFDQTLAGGSLTDTGVTPYAVQFNFIQITQTPAGLTPPNLFSHPAICLYDEDSYANQVNPENGDSFSDANDNTVTYNNLGLGVAKCYYAVQQGANGSPATPGVLPPEVVKGSGTFAGFQSDRLAEQNWLDQNGEILVIKPNDGSLLRNK